MPGLPALLRGCPGQFREKQLFSSRDPNMKYILRHLGLYLLAIWVSLTLNFLLPRTMPGDPVTRADRPHAREVLSGADRSPAKGLRVHERADPAAVLCLFVPRTDRRLRSLHFGLSGQSIRHHLHRPDVDRSAGDRHAAARLSAGHDPGRDRCLAARGHSGFGSAQPVQLHRLIPLFLPGDAGALLPGLYCSNGSPCPMPTRTCSRPAGRGNS